MPSRIKENYLKALHYLSHDSTGVSLKDLSQRMQVSQPTANAMVKKLADEKWLVYEKYKPIVLTESGYLAASIVVRRHRLTEMYLVQEMGFGWEEVHNIAEEIEHVKSVPLFDRMDEILGHPKVDPHGSPIPDKEGKIVSLNHLKLSEVTQGEKVRLAALTQSSHEFLEFLNSRKLELGSEFEVLLVETFDQSRTIKSEHGSIVLSREVCERLLVEVV